MGEKEEGEGECSQLQFALPSSTPALPLSQPPTLLSEQLERLVEHADDAFFVGALQHFVGSEPG
jgi:hypothetical protein